MLVHTMAGHYINLPSLLPSFPTHDSLTIKHMALPSPWLVRSMQPAARLR